MGELLQAHPGRDTDHDLAAESLPHGIGVEHGTHLVRLHTNQRHGGGARCLQIVGGGADAVALGQVSQGVGTQVGRQHLRWAKLACAQNSTQDGLAHGASANQGQSFVSFKDAHGRITTRTKAKVK